MGNLIESATWDDVYALAAGDAIGPSPGKSNDPHQNLLNRTKWLRDNLERHAHPLTHPLLLLKKSANITIPSDAVNYTKVKHDIVAADPYGMASLYDPVTGKFTPGEDFAGTYLVNWSLEMGQGMAAGQGYDCHCIIVKNYGGGSDTFTAAGVEPYVQEWHQNTQANNSGLVGVYGWKSEATALVTLGATDYIVVATYMTSIGPTPLPTLTSSNYDKYGNQLKIVRVG